VTAAVRPAGWRRIPTASIIGGIIDTRPNGGHVLRRTGALVPCLLLLAAACAKGTGADAPNPNENPVRVEVTSRHPLAVEVYAVANNLEQRLGTVHPGMNARFTIPFNLTTSGGVELVVGPPASNQRFRSGELLLAPGSVVDLIVAAQLFSSTATIRP
jgi:hypothetical protein